MRELTARRRGFALPATLLVLVAASALAASGFFRAFVELRTAENHAAAVRSFFVAEAGLNQALATIEADTAARWTRSWEIEDGMVEVRSRRILRLDPAREIRLLSAEGTYAPGREAAARRTVAQLVLAPTPVQPVAALVAADTARLGPAAEVSGLDRRGGECSGPDAVAGLALPPGGFLGDAAALSGHPPLLPLPSTRASLSSGLDWTNARRQEFVEPEALVSTEWSLPPATDPDAWPVTYVLPSAPPITGAVTGRGTLIVAGDLTVAGELRWSGLVLVAGFLDVPGELDLEGAVFVGLDGDTGAPTRGADLSGIVDIRYDGCAVAGAAARLSRGPIRRPGGWFEVF